MSIPSMSSEQLHAIVREFEQAVYHHERWAEKLVGTLVCRAPADPADLDAEAHRHCRFGQWYYGGGALALADHPAFTEIESQHAQLHKLAARLLETTARGEAPAPEDYDHFRKALKLLSTEITTLHRDLEDAVSNLDPLTGTPNRIAMLAGLREQHRLVKRGARPCAVALLDLDRLQQVNDAHGIDAGDKVLIAFAQHILAHLRSYDHVFRYSGAEFLILVRDADIEIAAQVLERLRAALGAIAHRSAQGSFHVTASLGAAPLDPEVPVELSIERAAEALRAAKDSGRNRLFVWTAEGTARAA